MVVGNLLDTTPTGDIVASRGKFEQAIARSLYRALHKPFPVAFLTYNYGPIEVLQRTGYDLRRGCTLFVDKHSKREVQGNRRRHGAVGVVGRGITAFHVQHLRIMRNKETYNLDGRLHPPPAVATEVNDKAFEGSNLRKRGKRLTDILARVLGKL